MAGSVERDDIDLNMLRHNPGTCVYDPEGQLAVACAAGSVYLGFDGHNVSGALYTSSVTYPDAGWSFVHGPSTDDPLIGYHRQLGGERILYFVTDGQGRVLAVADSSGYRSPGDNSNSGIARWQSAGGSVSGNSFKADRMSGGDVPKLSFYRNRAYDQTTGRWTQEDPIGMAGGLNLYQFNGNNPVSYRDPFGLLPIVPIVWGAGEVLAAVGGTALLTAVVYSARDKIEAAAGKVVGFLTNLIAAGTVATAGSSGKLPEEPPKKNDPPGAPIPVKPPASSGSGDPPTGPTGPVKVGQMERSVCSPRHQMARSPRDQRHHDSHRREAEVLLIQRAWWWMLRRLYRARRVQASDLELEILDARPPGRRNLPELKAVVADALERISAAKGGFGELVTSHLRTLAAMEVSRELVIPRQQVYVCRFDGAERSNGHYLACLLIWAATSIRLARNSAAHKIPMDKSAIKQASQQAQLRFLRQFPGWEEWVDALDLG